MTIKSVKFTIVLLLVVIVIAQSSCINTNCDSNYSEPFKVHITSYIDDGTCASGEHTRIGVCAMKKEWIGKTAIVYLRDEDGNIGDVYGIYEIEDCGGTDGLKDGKVIDIWMPNLDSAKTVMKETNGLGYVQLVDAKG